MRSRLIIRILGVIWSASLSQAPGLFAQPSLVRNYTFLYDSCPDPVRNHIATRRIYEPLCNDTSNHNPPDTIIEFYDPDGKLTAVEERPGNGLNPHLAERHHFYYDRQERIICDSTYNHYQVPLKVTTYEYTPFKCVIHYSSPYKYVDEFPMRIINYDGYNNVESQYDVNAAGDTMCSRIRVSDVLSTYVFRKYLADSTLTNIDSGTTVTTPQQSWDLFYFYYLYEDTSTTLYSNFYNAAGQKIVNVSVRNNILCDCTAYYYENNRLVCEERRVYDDWDRPTPRTVRFTQHELYTYNTKGQLTEKREWSTYPDREPFGVTVTTYIYNERGLRIEENVMYEDLNGNLQHVQSCERWEYTYY